jgi:hypothetical protein
MLCFRFFLQYRADQEKEREQGEDTRKWGEKEGEGDIRR